MSILGAAMMRSSRRPLILDISNTASPNIPNLLSAAGWRGIRQPVIIENSALVNTLVIPNSLSGADITILNKTGARIGGVKNGGTALRTQIQIKVDNQGTISGGGGKGGNGGNGECSRNVPVQGYQRAFAYGGSGGLGQGFSLASSLTISDATDGSVGNVRTVPATGSWGGDSGRGSMSAYGGTGGHGGGWGNGGTAGYGGYASGDYDTNTSTGGYYGGSGGYHTDGNNLVTWVNTGTRLGRVLA